jgi:hypothetical protein
MGSEALPDWALLALEKRARLLESALSQDDDFLELEPGQQGVVLEELQEATQRAASLEFLSSDNPPPTAVSHPKPPSHQSVPSHQPAPSHKPVPTSRTIPQKSQNEHRPKHIAIPPTSPAPVTNAQVTSTPNMYNQQTVNPLMFNPFIASQHVFPNAETYQEYLRVQEQQIKIARDHLKLQISMGQIPKSPIFPVQHSANTYSPLLQPPQQLATPTSSSANYSSATPPPAPTQHFYYPSKRTSPAPPPPSVIEAVQIVNKNNNNQSSNQNVNKPNQEQLTPQENCL